ncbi:MAG: class II fructose-1,6-bisphosphate aldolase [Mycoplasmataceae bacterium]|nr:class II fructose-1,6-bisphosphate aldolase [Mycoplasmataceae bacterium]
MLVNSKEVLIKAEKNRYAVGQYNINNMEWTKAVLEVAQANKSPVIIGVSEGAAKYMGGYKAVAMMVEGMDQSLKITVPVILHLDHGTSFASCKDAIDAGFTSVMIDGSHESIKNNVKVTRKVVEYAAKFDVSVEAEVGTVGGTEDGITGGVNYASLDECLAISKTGIDSLAASLGSVHGHYEGEPNLGFAEMEQYSKATKLPLVLHGGSGIPDEMIAKAISAGEAKINVNTEIQENFAKGIRQYIEEKKDLTGTGYDPRKIIGTYAYVNMKKVVQTKIDLFGTAKKA